MMDATSPRVFVKANLFAWMLFLFFVTLHADQLNVVFGGYTVRLNNLLAFGLMIFVLISLRGHILSINKWLALSLLLITVSITCSLILSPYKERCSLYLGWYGLTVLCYVLLPYLIMKFWDAEKVFSLYQASFLCVGCYALFQLLLSFVGICDPFATQSLSGNIVRPNAFCFEPSFYALYMTPFVFFYNIRELSRESNRATLLNWLCLLGVNILYLISTSTATFFAYGAFFLILLTIPGIISRRKVFIFISIFCSGAFFLFLFFPFMMKHFFLKFFFHGFMAHHSFYERWIGIENGWNIFIQHPFFGVGLGGYPPYLMDAYLRGDTTFSFIGMHALIGEVVNPVKMFEAMNAFTELMASLGLVGLCAFGSLLYGLFVQLRQTVESEKRNACCWLVSMIITLIVLQFNQGIFRTYIWVHLAMVYAYLEKTSSAATVLNHEPATIHHPA